MTESKHTPGPWNIGWGLVWNAARGITSRVSGEAWKWKNKDGFESESKANARLIAAAPDLLEACEDALASLDALAEEGIIEEGKEAGTLRAAIAKAKGE